MKKIQCRSLAPTLTLLTTILATRSKDHVRLGTNRKVEGKALLKYGSWISRDVGHFELDRDILNAVDPIKHNLVDHLVVTQIGQ